MTEKQLQPRIIKYLKDKGWLAMKGDYSLKGMPDIIAFRNGKTLMIDVKVTTTEYDFLFNKNLPIEEAIQKFIELKFSKTIKLTTIKDSINEEKSLSLE